MCYEKTKNYSIYFGSRLIPSKCVTTSVTFDLSILNMTLFECAFLKNAYLYLLTGPKCFKSIVFIVTQLVTRDFDIVG